MLLTLHLSGCDWKDVLLVVQAVAGGWRDLVRVSYNTLLIMSTLNVLSAVFPNLPQVDAEAQPWEHTQDQQVTLTIRTLGEPLSPSIQSER